MGAEGVAEGPDFAAGIAAGECPDEGTIAGRVGDQPVLLSRFAGEWFAVSGSCTHYGALLAKGLVDGAQVRCPLHHACFDLKTGAALRAPALDPLDRWKVEVDADRLFVREKLATQEAGSGAGADIANVVIVGGGAAGLACANELRVLGYGGAITMVSADADPPCDRPNLSKDYLAGKAPEEWIPLRPDDWYRDHRIDLRLRSEVQRIDAAGRAIILAGGKRMPFDRLLLATGSEPRRLVDGGISGERVFTLRTLADARAIINRAKEGSRAAIIGSSFIGMEAAAALRERGLEVDVVSPEQVPFETVLGKELGSFLKRLHEDHGVRFHLGTVAAALGPHGLVLANGESIAADLVLVGVGVLPRTSLAEAAGLDTGNGVWVDEYLRTSCLDIYAAGDIAAYPDPMSGERVRIEHWAVAERQGQTAAANMLGLNRKYSAAPFFWTEQYGVSIRYVGHARGWDEARIDGEIGTGGCVVRYHRGGKHLASASINRDRENLEDELRLERRA